MRVPKTNDDPKSNCLGGSIERFLNKLAPGQLKLYCKVIPEKFQHPDQNGVTQVFYPNQNLGKHKIRELFKKGAGILELPNAKDFCASSLCSMFITNLANGDGVSLRECMDSSRHNSVAASNIY